MTDEDIMLIYPVERRLAQRPGIAGSAYLTEIVRESLLMQHTTGTVSAIEFLKANTVDGIVIQRVLSGNPVRGEDVHALLSYPAVFET